MARSHLKLSENLVLSKDIIQFKYYIILLTVFIATWLTSDIAAIKLVSVFGITLTGGFIIFPFTTTLSSIIVEVYGYKNSRQAIWSGVILNATFVFFINLIYLIPSSSYWNLNDQFKAILIPGMRIAIASLISFITSDFINSYLMAKMKIKSQGKSLIKRIIVSCGFSFLFDITFFFILAFYGTISNELLTKLIFYAYIKKVFCQIAFFPIVDYLVYHLKRLEGIDIYDCNTKFNPFSFDNVYDFNILNNKKMKNLLMKKNKNDIEHAIV